MKLGIFSLPFLLFFREVACQVPPAGISPTDFYKWRPRYHIQAASNWMNDPCAPFYDEVSKTYHVSFQYNPAKNDWDDISWGQASSTDLINWTVGANRTLRPDQPYDKLGIFTGAAFPKRQNDEIVIAYTAVDNLPISYKIPYNYGAEKLALASSKDNGKTWIKHTENPILPGAPAGINVSGFRDPYMSSWPAMSKLLGHNPDEWLYGIISGGIKDVTPTSFLFKINANNYSDWRFISPIMEPGLNFNPSVWVADYGVNWEVTNFLSLKDADGRQFEFLVMGAEGILSLPAANSPRPLPLRRPTRAQKWLGGHLNKTDASEPRLQYDFGGSLDYGALYAANSYYDVRSRRHIVWGWVGEDDLSEELRRVQGWSGALSLPRHVSIQTLKRVIKARASPVEKIGTFVVTKDKRLRNGPYQVSTLSIEPLEELKGLRKGAKSLKLNSVSLGAIDSPSRGRDLLPLKTSFWELEASIRVSASCQEVGLRIYYTADQTSFVSLIFTPQTETFTIDRSKAPQGSSTYPVNVGNDVAPFTLFTYFDEKHSAAKEETLDIRVFHDASVVEIFVNGRTVISTRVYGELDKTYGARFFATDAGNAEKSRLLSARAWDGLKGRIEFN